MAKASELTNPEQQSALTKLSRALSGRLQRNDGEALREIYDLFSPAVRGRLAHQFRGVLGESDLDDVMSTALLRLWTYRQRYAPARASLYTWFCLIARSEALRVARCRAGEPRVYLSDLSRSELGALAFSRSPAAGSSASSLAPELQAVESFLGRLDERDQQLLLAFAEHEGREPWAAQLSTRWRIPASTVRSTKHRLVDRLRHELQAQGFRIPQKASPMSTAAPVPRPSKPQANPVAAPPPPARGESAFLHANADRVRQFAEGFRKYCQEFQPAGAEQGFPHFHATWNEAFERDELHDPAKREVLVKTYEWLLDRSARENRYRNGVTKFIQQDLQAEGFGQTSFGRAALDVQVDRIETAMSGLGRNLEDQVPAPVTAERRGRVFLSWRGDAAELRWNQRSRHSLNLRNEVRHAFELYGDVARDALPLLTQGFMHNVQRSHTLLPPHFNFPPELPPEQAPAYWEWKLPEAVPAAGKLPVWLEKNLSAPAALPNPLEHELRERNPALADLLDELLVGAALEDLTLVHAGQTAKALGAVSQLVEFVARESGRPNAEIAGLFQESLRNQQAQSDESEICQANTEALLFLWSQLAEM